MEQEIDLEEVKAAVETLKAGGVILYPTDTVWGIGLKATDERATDVTQWRGENLLGFSLMIVRDKFLMNN